LFLASGKPQNGGKENEEKRNVRYSVRVPGPDAGGRDSDTGGTGSSGCAQPQPIAAAGYDLEIQSIFDSAADYEKYPQMEDPQEEVQFLESYVSPAQKASMP
jgi:hypothetical protein